MDAAGYVSSWLTLAGSPEGWMLHHCAPALTLAACIRVFKFGFFTRR